MIAACPLAFGETRVEGRIKGVMNYKKPAFYAPYLGNPVELTQSDTDAVNGASLSSIGYTETSHPYGGQTVGSSHDGHHSENHHDDSHH